jgi:hypothetical protein
MFVGSLDHLDNCKSLIYLKACFKMVIFFSYDRTGQDKGDLLIEVTALTGLTVY